MANSQNLDHINEDSYENFIKVLADYRIRKENLLTLQIFYVIN